MTIPFEVIMAESLANPEVKTDKLALSGALLNTGSAALKGAVGTGAAGILGGVGSAVGGSSPTGVGASLVPATAKGALAAPQAGSSSLPQLPSVSTLTNALPKKPSVLDLLK